MKKYTVAVTIEVEVPYHIDASKVAEEMRLAIDAHSSYTPKDVRYVERGKDE